MFWVQNLHPERAIYGNVEITLYKHFPIGAELSEHCYIQLKEPFSQVEICLYPSEETSPSGATAAMSVAAICVIDASTRLISKCQHYVTKNAPVEVAVSCYFLMNRLEPVCLASCT